MSTKCTDRSEIIGPTQGQHCCEVYLTFALDDSPAAQLLADCLKFTTNLKAMVLRVPIHSIDHSPSLALPGADGGYHYSAESWRTLRIAICLHSSTLNRLMVGETQDQGMNAQPDLGLTVQ